MACIKDLILTSKLAGTFRTAAALLGPFTECLIHSAVDILAWMGSVEIKRQGSTEREKTDGPRLSRANAPWTDYGAEG